MAAMLNSGTDSNLTKTKVDGDRRGLRQFSGAENNIAERFVPGALYEAPQSGLFPRRKQAG